MGGGSGQAFGRQRARELTVKECVAGGFPCMSERKYVKTWAGPLLHAEQQTATLCSYAREDGTHNDHKTNATRGAGEISRSREHVPAKKKKGWHGRSTKVNIMIFG